MTTSLGNSGPILIAGSSLKQVRPSKNHSISFTDLQAGTTVVVNISGDDLRELSRTSYFEDYEIAQTKELPNSYIQTQTRLFKHAPPSVVHYFVIDAIEKRKDYVIFLQEVSRITYDIDGLLTHFYQLDNLDLFSLIPMSKKKLIFGISKNYPGCEKDYPREWVIKYAIKYSGSNLYCRQLIGNVLRCVSDEDLKTNQYKYDQDMRSMGKEYADLQYTQLPATKKYHRYKTCIMYALAEAMSSGNQDAVNYLLDEANLGENNADFEIEVRDKAEYMRSQMYPD